MQVFKVAFAPLARTTFDMDLARQMIHTFAAELDRRGFSVTGSADPITSEADVQARLADFAGQGFDLLLVFQATFADSTMVGALAEAVDAPVFLWAVPEAREGGRLRLNSLCGVNLAAHALTLHRRKYEYRYAPPDDAEGFAYLRTVAAAGRALRKLHSARLAVVGEHPAGMDTCHLDAEGLKARLGVSVDEIPLPAVFERVRQVPESQTAQVQASLAGRVQGLDGLDQAALHRSLGVYSVLKEIAQQDQYEGLAVRCWPEFFTELGCAACGPMSMLTSENVPCSCEADINGTVTQFILQALSGETAFGTDIVSVDCEADEIVFWHCGLAPVQMADPDFQPRATIHTNRKMPLLMEFPLKPGPVTVARLSQATGELRLVIGRAEMLRRPMSFTGTSGTVRFERPAEAVLDTLIREGLEHHVSLTYGDHVEALRTLARWLNLPILEL